MLRWSVACNKYDILDFGYIQSLTLREALSLNLPAFTRYPVEWLDDKLENLMSDGRVSILQAWSAKCELFEIWVTYKENASSTNNTTRYFFDLDQVSKHLADSKDYIYHYFGFVGAAEYKYHMELVNKFDRGVLDSRQVVDQFERWVGHFNYVSNTFEPIENNDLPNDIYISAEFYNREGLPPLYKRHMLGSRFQDYTLNWKKTVDKFVTVYGHEMVLKYREEAKHLAKCLPMYCHNVNVGEMTRRDMMNTVFLAMNKENPCGNSRMLDDPSTIIHCVDRKELLNRRNQVIRRELSEKNVNYYDYVGYHRFIPDADVANNRYVDVKQIEELEGGPGSGVGKINWDEYLMPMLEPTSRQPIWVVLQNPIDNWNTDFKSVINVLQICQPVSEKEMDTWYIVQGGYDTGTDVLLVQPVKVKVYHLKQFTYPELKQTQMFRSRCTGYSRRIMESMPQM